jgi:hypothetical protein
MIRREESRTVNAISNKFQVVISHIGGDEISEEDGDVQSFIDKRGKVVT